MAADFAYDHCCPSLAQVLIYTGVRANGKTVNGSGSHISTTVLLSQRIADAIRAKVIKGDIKADHSLPSERILALEFAVSRNVIRESCKILESEGYLITQPGKGRIVQSRPSTPSWMRERLAKERMTVRHLMEIRLLVEPELARLAAERSNSRETLAMEEILTKAEGIVDDPGQWIASDRDFHLLVAAAAHNPMLELIMGSVLEFTTKLRMLLIENAPKSLYQSQLLHKSVLNSIVQHDGRHAEAFMRAHIEQVRKDVECLAEQGILEPLDWPLG